jgi:DNA-binding NarL/FixJ family response regulator
MHDKQIRILLADDHPGFRAGIRAEIDREPDMAVVGEAESGTEALRLVKALHPDVLLLDMEMPGLTGVEVAQALQRERIDVLVLPLSGFRDSEYVFALLESGAAGYMTKDESLDNIIRAIRSVARGGVYVSPRVAVEIVDVKRRQRREVTAEERLRDELNELGFNGIRLEVLQLVARGLTNAEIGEKLDRSEHTIRHHVQVLREITGQDWRPGLVAWAWKRGAMDVDPGELDE